MTSHLMFSGDEIPILKNRIEAAALLSKLLSEYAHQEPLVLGIPRGGVPMAATIAKALHGHLDVVLVHKLGAPHQPELAIGAVDETGELYISPVARSLDIPKELIEEEAGRQLALLAQRRRTYTPARTPRDPKDRIVIIVDDGSATGATMLAALHTISAKKPRKLIAAMAVAPPETVRRLEEKADEVVCVGAPEDFYAVGQFFADFSPVSDEEVITILSQFSSEK